MYEFAFYRVEDVMTTHPMTVYGDVSRSEAEAIFEEHDFNGLPVVEQDGRLLGMVTKLDLLKAFIFTDKTVIPPYPTLMNPRVTQVMTRASEMVRTDTPLTRVLQKMVETRHKSFPVVESDRLVGIVAREDVLRALRRAALGRLPPRTGEEGLSRDFEIPGG
jgi:CBS domain-containing protein